MSSILLIFSLFSTIPNFSLQKYSLDLLEIIIFIYKHYKYDSSYFEQYSSYFEQCKKQINKQENILNYCVIYKVILIQHKEI